MVLVYPPVLRTNGTHTCSIRSDEDAPFLIQTPTVYWDKEKQTLSPLHEGGDAWLKGLQTLETEVLLRIHQKRWDSFRHGTLHALQAGFVSAVELDGKRVRVVFEPSAPDEESFSTGCVHGSLRMDRLVMDLHNGYHIRWVLESVTPFSKTVPCLFEEDHMTLYESEWQT